MWPPTDTALVYVFAKEPVPGSVKTRLSPPLDPEQAARCYRAFLTDTVERFAGTPGAELRVAVSERPAPFVESLCRRLGLQVCGQGAGDLGRRLERVMGVHAGESRPVILVASDVPDLPLAILASAVSALERAPVVIGPGHDGGYYLIGARGGPPPVFDLDTAWGGAGVLAETLGRLRLSGTDPVLLPEWPDVDDYEDLCALDARLAAAGEARPRHSEALLAALRDEGVGP